jgi:YfiH family protein
VPILLVHEGGAGVAAIHAGWRGSAAAISERATREFCAALELAPRELVAVVGPHIGVCCYEVDAPVRDAIADSRAFRAAERRGHYMLDLFALNRAQLVAAGVDGRRVWRVGGCTSCDASGYPSYRRDRTSGRMSHWVRQRSH